MTEIMDNNTEQLQEQQSQETETTADAEQAPAGKMFTQEEVNRIVGDRLERQRKQIESSLNDRIAYVEDVEAAIERYEIEKLRKEIAAEYRIPEAMANRIRGDNRGDMVKDAATIASAFGCFRGTPSSQEAPAVNSYADAFSPGGDKHEPMQFLQRSDYDV